MLLIFGMVSYAFLTNLTKHPGYEIYKTEALAMCACDTESQSAGEVSEAAHVNESSDEIMLSTKDIVTDYDLLMVLLGSGLIGFIYCLGEITINIVAMSNFRWSLTTVSVVTLFCVLVATTLMKILQILKGITNTYYLYALCVVLNWLFVALLLVTLNIHVTRFSLQTIMFFLFLICLLYTSPSPRDS